MRHLPIHRHDQSDAQLIDVHVHNHDRASAGAAAPGAQRHGYWQRALRRIGADLHSERTLLLPVRLFIGLGWLRAGTEKLVDPHWLDGSGLTRFLSGQLASGQVVFPFYEGLVTSTFLPHAQLLSWIVLIGQLLAGLAILAGCFTRPALLGGLFMNLNFLLVGVPNPSAFYFVIQLTLLLTDSGAVFSVDGWLRQWQRRAKLSGASRSAAWPALVVLLLCAVAAASAARAISDFSPAGSVHDPAMILTILASMTAGWAGLGFLRSLLPTPSAEAPGNDQPRVWYDTRLDV